jgi:hypothetical protein
MDVMRHPVWSTLGGCLVVAIVLTACATPPATSMKHKTDPNPASSVIVQSLQRQIKERDKYIAELESRLHALKIIDQDMEKRRNFNRPPATVTPAVSPTP